MTRFPAIATLALALAAAFGASSALAADETKLATERNCLACHATQKKLVGPSFKDVAERYAGKPGSQEKLAAKILKGGSGVWGPVPMPANGQVSPDEASRLAGWVLTTK